MKKIKWGVMGTAFICERSTFPGMLQAENCEMYAIAGRSMEKAAFLPSPYSITTEVSLSIFSSEKLAIALISVGSSARVLKIRLVL